MRRLALFLAVVATGLMLSKPYAASTEAPSKSPLEAYLGFGHHPDQEEELYAAEQAQRELMIADCMRAAGFAYWPRPGDILLEPGETEPINLPPDPNVPYRESLDAKAAEGYARALGGRSAADGITAEEMRILDKDGDGRIVLDERAQLGCLGRAERALPGVFEIVGQLSDEIEKMDTDFASDPRTPSAQTTWSQCMTDAAGADSASQACHLARSEAMRQVRVEVERRFYDRNREVIESVAEPAVIH